MIVHFACHKCFAFVFITDNCLHVGLYSLNFTPSTAGNMVSTPHLEYVMQAVERQDFAPQ